MDTCQRKWRHLEGKVPDLAGLQTEHHDHFLRVASGRAALRRDKPGQLLGLWRSHPRRRDPDPNIEVRRNSAAAGKLRLTFRLRAPKGTTLVYFA